MDALAEALLDGGDELLGNPPAGDFILEDERLFGVLGQHVQPAHDMGELAGTARLLFVTDVEFGRLRGGLAVVDLRRAHFHLDVELAANPLHINFQVQLAHAGHDRFAGLLVHGNVQRGILAAEALQGLAQPIGAVAVGGGNGHLDDRLRHEHALQRAVGIGRGIGVAAGRVDAQDGHDIAGVRRIDVFALVGVHAHDAAEALFAAVALIVVGLALAEAALVNPHEGERAVGVLDDLEGHGHGRLFRVGRQDDFLGVVVMHESLALHVQRRGQVVDHGVQ